MKCECCKKTIIGREVPVEFLEFSTHDTILAKVDTGAYTGGLHVEDIEEVDGVLQFRPLSEKHEIVRVEKYRKKWVKSSTGVKETRFVIKTPVIMAGHKMRLELTLANRKQMKYDMLVGRKNLNNKFLVDVSK